MPDRDVDATLSPLAAVSNVVVSLHKQQFGRGPTRARSHFAGPDSLICVLEDALLPAEVSMIEMGEARRVEETRLYFQNATAGKFKAAIEEITGRSVWSFASATDASTGVVTEIFHFYPQDGQA
jgi:uncharacterized protein YbcI